MASGRSRKSALGTKRSDRQNTDSKKIEPGSHQSGFVEEKNLKIHANMPKSPEDEIKRFTDQEWVEILLTTDLNEI